MRRVMNKIEKDHSIRSYHFYWSGRHAHEKTLGQNMTHSKCLRIYLFPLTQLLCQRLLSSIYPFNYGQCVRYAYIRRSRVTAHFFTVDLD